MIRWALAPLGLLILAFFALQGVEAEDPPSPPPPSGFAGSDACLTCHETQGHTLMHPHPEAQDPKCESCHGPGQAHVDAGGDPNLMQSFAEMAAGQANARCQTCHTWQEQRFWPAGAHSRAGVTCVSCHAVHRAEGANPHLLRQPDELSTCFTCHGVMRTRTWKSSHMPVREGKLSCGDCHNPHGSASEKMLRDPSQQENCYRCHAEKRGPTLFEHPPVRENCMNCHDPHGSMHENLLVTRPPRLCQNCHVNARHPSEPRQVTGSGSRFVFNKACVNCHTSVHGSNSPAGVRQQR